MNTQIENAANEIETIETAAVETAAAETATETATETQGEQPARRGSNPVGPKGVLLRPIDLNVPYVLRAKAKAMGAWFNFKTKTWVAPKGANYGAFKAAGFVGKPKAA